MDIETFANVESNAVNLRKKQDQMQKKTFTKWYNSYLKHRNIEVVDLVKDMHDAVILLNLLEIISSEKVGKYNKTAKMRVMKLENAQTAIDFIKRHNIKVTGIGAEDLCDGNEKLILGLSWILILRYEIQKFSADIQELLRWCKARTVGYDNVRVQNFSESFNDGLAFCALINKHYPELLNFDQLDPANVRDNLERAFELADREFGVPRLLDVQDMIDGPDEKSVITYVAKLRQAFSDKDNEMMEAARLAELQRLKEDEEARRRAQEEADAARRRAEEEAEEARRRALEAAERERREQELRNAADALNNLFPGYLNRQEHEAETDRLIGDFGPKADDLAQWIADSDRNMGDKLQRVEELSGEQIISALEDLNQFSSGEKPPHHDQLLDLGNAQEVINARLAKEGRPPMQHPNDYPHLTQAWGGMEATEREYRNALLLRAKRLGLVQPLIERFRRIAERLNEWRQRRGVEVDSTEFAPTESEVLLQLRQFRRLETEIAPQNANVRALDNLGRLIKQQDAATYGPEVDAKLSEAHSFYDNISTRVTARRTAIQKEYERQQRLEEERIAYTRRTSDLANLVDEGEELTLHPLEAVDNADALRRFTQTFDASFDGLATTPQPAGFDAELVASLMSRAQLVRDSLRQRASTPDHSAERARAESALVRSSEQAARDFKLWYAEATRTINALLDDISAQNKDSAHNRVEQLRRSLPMGQDRLSQVRNVANQFQDSSAALGVPAACALGASATPSQVSFAQATQEANLVAQNLESLFRHHTEQVDRLSEEIRILDVHHLSVPSTPAVVAALRTLADRDSGVLDEQALRERGVSESNIQYLSGHVGAASRGGLDYEAFDPYQGRTIAPPPKSSSSGYSTPSRQGSLTAVSPASATSSPAIGRSSQFGVSSSLSSATPSSSSPASLYRQNSAGPTSSPMASRSPAFSNASVPLTSSSLGNSPYKAGGRPTSGYEAFSPASPTTSRPSSFYASGSNSASPASFSAPRNSAPEPVVHGPRESNPLDHGINMLITQTSESPMVVKYELEVTSQKRVDMTLNFEGSQNMEMVWSSTGDSGLKVTTVVMPFETRTLAVLRQIDPYAPSSVAVKQQWRTSNMA